jgi:hypothetical protein
MDFDEAIQAHTAWKIELSTYLRNPDGTLGSAEVRALDRCVLGQWLHGEGAKHSMLLEYQNLLKQHARFHDAAANVVDKANSGRETSADHALNFDSEYGEASRNVVKAIVDLKKKVSAA